MTEVKRMSLIIPPDLHRAFKAAAVSQGREMTELILEFMQSYIQRYAAPALTKRNQKRGRR
jgi:hypothetical protein